MALCAGPGRSSLCSRLNPNAPFFVPAAFLAAEDFSPEWWHLVQTSPAFREYWLAERFDPEVQLASDFEIFGHEAFFPDVDFGSADLNADKQEENLPPFSSVDAKDVARMAGLKEVDVGAKQSRLPFSPLPYQAKPLKVAQPQKPSLRIIQQPC